MAIGETQKAINTTSTALDTVLPESGTMTQGSRKVARVKDSLSNLNLRVMLAILNWTDACNRVGQSLEDVQEREKSKHWKAVQQSKEKMLEGRWQIFGLTAAGAILTGAGAGIGYNLSQSSKLLADAHGNPILDANGRIQELPGANLLKIFGISTSRDNWTGISGAFNAFGQVPGAYGQNIVQQTREAHVKVLDANVQRQEKKSQAPSQKTQKLERNEEAAQQLIKQMLQADSQVLDAINSLSRAH